MTIIAEWGSSLIGWLEGRQRIPEDKKIRPGEEYEIVNEIEEKEPMTAHEWGTIVGHIANKWREKAPDGAELRYVSLEKSSRPKLRLQFKAHQQASPTIFGMTIAEFIAEYGVDIIIAVVVGVVGYEAIRIAHTFANQITGVVENPTAHPVKTALLMGGILGGLYLLTR